MNGFDERDHLAITQILRSKRRAEQFLKVMQGQPFDKVVEEAKKYAKELREKKAQDRLQVRELSAEEQAQRKELLFILRNLALMGLPHKPTKEPSIRRVIRQGPSSWVSITLTARGAHDTIPEEGRVYLPFGINARRALAMICTLAVKTQNPIITLDSAAEFMTKLGWKPDARGSHGGNKYTLLSSILDQLQKCSIDVDAHGVFGSNRRQAESISIISKYDLPSLADDKLVEQGAQPLPLESEDKHGFCILIDPLFFRELCGDPRTGYKGSAFPLPLEFMRTFTRSTEVDTAQFLVARVSGAQSESKIDLHHIHEQLAFHPGNYGNFKKEFTETLEKVKAQWKGCNARIEGQRLVVGPVLNGDYLVDPTKFEYLPEDLFGLNTPLALDNKQ